MKRIVPEQRSEHVGRMKMSYAPLYGGTITITAPHLARFRRNLLQWASGAGRQFFWRERPVSPYEILVVEILLSRTRAEAVQPVALRLIEQFPTAQALAIADAEAVERIVYSLGLYRKRAGRLVSCAQTLVERYGGRVPSRLEELTEFPYVGRYAANAVMCFAYGQRRPVIDANVSRVHQRVFSLPRPPARLSSAHDLWEFATAVLPRKHVKEFNWALLDLGGTICIPRCRRARTSGALPGNGADFCARLVRMGRGAYLRTAAFCLRTARPT